MSIFVVVVPLSGAWVSSNKGALRLHCHPALNNYKQDSETDIVRVVGYTRGLLCVCFPALIQEQQVKFLPGECTSRFRGILFRMDAYAYAL